MTSDAGALLLGATDRAIGLIERFAACFTDGRRAELTEHEVRTLVGQRVFGIALGYKISLITTSCATTRPWRCWPAIAGSGATATTPSGSPAGTAAISSAMTA